MKLELALIFTFLVILPTACKTKKPINTDEGIPMEVVDGYECWNGSRVLTKENCPQYPMPIIEPECWDGTMVFDPNHCPIICPDGTKSTSKGPDYTPICPTSS
jgi:hypothetical protein